MGEQAVNIALLEFAEACSLFVYVADQAVVALASPLLARPIGIAIEDPYPYDAVLVLLYLGQAAEFRPVVPKEGLEWAVFPDDPQKAQKGLVDCGGCVGQQVSPLELAVRVIDGEDAQGIGGLAYHRVDLEVMALGVAFLPIEEAFECPSLQQFGVHVLPPMVVFPLDMESGGSWQIDVPGGQISLADVAAQGRFADPERRVAAHDVVEGLPVDHFRGDLVVELLHAFAFESRVASGTYQIFLGVSIGHEGIVGDYVLAAAVAHGLRAGVADEWELLYQRAGKGIEGVGEHPPFAFLDG